MRGMQCNVEFVYQLIIGSRIEENHGKTLIDLEGRKTFRVHADF
jgi:hypothetical protein